MSSKDKILKETSPLSIFLVKSGSAGNRLLFKYPFSENFQDELNSEQDQLQLGNIINENDEALCNMFSVNPNLCGKKFEIKINSVRYVGHPMSLLPPNPTGINSSSVPHQTAVNQVRQAHHHQVDLSPSSYGCLTAPHSSQNIYQGDITSFNIVCALRASASYDIVDCYHDLSKRLAIALSFEERRCSYLSKEIKTISATLDESDMANLASKQHEEHLHSLDNGVSKLDDSLDDSHRESDSVFDLILSRSNLAKDLKRIFLSLSISGIIDLKINNWVSVSFCLPQKVHRLKLISHKSMPAIGTQDIRKCLHFLRPYHGILLLYEAQELLDLLPIDASPALIQLIKVTKPDKNLLDLSVDANLTLMQIFCIVSQLIYWAKATIIYPICDSNIYAIHPLASTGKQTKLVSDFRARFPNSKSLHYYLADFSEGISLSQLNSPLLNLDEKLNLLAIVTWLLQRRILIQIHKYIFLVVDKATEQDIISRPSNHNQTLGESLQSSPQGIEIEVPPNYDCPTYGRSNTIRGPLMQSSSVESSSHIFKNSFSDSMESSMKPFRSNSFAESQEDSNFGPSSSLSSTPNSNLEYPSPSNYTNNRLSLSTSYPLDNPLGIESVGSILSALQGAGLSHAGAKNILEIPSSRNQDDLKLLIRLIPYFDGKHHIEDIMFFENLDRSQILILCDKFRSVLLTCHYEDVAVSQLSPFDSSKQLQLYIPSPVNKSSLDN